MIRLPVFMYHHVAASLGAPAKNMYIPPEHFKQQMLFLYEQGLRCLSLSEVVTNLREGRAQPDRSFVLTFDDGYADVYENALPILERLGFPATIFVVVKQVEESNKRYLSWQGMRELAQNNFIIGSHTLTHPMLSKLDRMTIKRELQESKEIIEDRVGLPVHLLAYPSGDSNELVQNAAREAGYLAACGVGVGPSSLFNIWRVPVNQHESQLTFHWKANGGYYTYTWLREMTYLGRTLREFKRKTLERKGV